MSVSCIVPYRSTSTFREELFEVVVGRIMTLMPDWDLIISDCNGDFSRSGARNNGASLADGDVLVFCDADTIWNPEYLHEAIELAEKNGWALPYTMYYNINAQSTDNFLDNDPYEDFPRPSEDDYEHALDYVISGTVVVTREAFETVGGYDERFIDWGYEDDAFATALAAFYGQPARVDGFVCHLWHPVENGDAFNHPHIEHNRTLHKQYQRAAGTPQAMRRFLDERPSS